MNQPSVSASFKKVLKTSSLSIAFASLLLLLGCPSNSNKPTETNVATNTSTAPVAAKSDFDGDRAFEHVRKQVQFGPRPPGSPELEKARTYILDQLKAYGLK